MNRIQSYFVSATSSRRNRNHRLCFWRRPIVEIAWWRWSFPDISFLNFLYISFLFLYSRFIFFVSIFITLLLSLSVLLLVTLWDSAQIHLLRSSGFVFWLLSDFRFRLKIDVFNLGNSIIHVLLGIVTLFVVDSLFHRSILILNKDLIRLTLNSQSDGFTENELLVLQQLLSQSI